MRTLRALPLLLALAACAAHPADSGVRIVFTQRPPELPFDPEDARLRAAQAQLAELLGHPLVIDVDAALLPQWQGSFRWLLVEAVEHVARDVRHVKEETPVAFSTQLTKLQRIECRYVATAPSRRSELAPDGKTLRIFTTADDRELVPRGLVAEHVRRAYESAQHDEFRGKAPGAIASGKEAAYFADLTARSDRGEGSLAESIRADAIRSVIDLDARVNGALRVELRHWLASSGADFFSSAYIHRGAEVKGYPAGSRFRGAERAFGGWVNRTQKALPAEDRLTLLRHLYPRPFTQNREPGRHFVTFAFPAADRDAILFDVIDEWIAEGHRMPEYERSGGPVPKPLHEWVLCPRPKSPEGSRSLAPHCDDVLYERAMEDPAVTARLAATLVQKQDALLTETVFANYDRDARVEFAIALWRKLGDARDEADSKVAARVLAELAENGAPELLMTEAKSRTRGKDRGAALYLLAVGDRYAKTKVDWKTFPASYGKIRDVDLRDLLHTGPHGLALVPTIWPALEQDVKKAEPLLAYYDAFLTAPETRRYQAQDPWLTYRALHGSFCREGLMREIAVLRAYYQRQQTRDPEHARIWVDFLDETSPQKCRSDFEHAQRGTRLDAELEQQRRKQADDERRRQSDRPVSR